MSDLYLDGKLKFVANAGLMAKPVTTADYRGDTPVQLFAHNAMTLEASREDLYDEYAGSGVGGRMADILSSASIPTNVFSCQPEMDVRFVTKHEARSICRHAKLCICLRSYTVKLPIRALLHGVLTKLWS